MNLVKHFGIQGDFETYKLDFETHLHFQEQIKRKIFILMTLYCLKHFLDGTVSIGIEDNVKVKEIPQNGEGAGFRDSKRIKEKFPDALYKYQRTGRELFDYFVCETTIHSFDHDKPFSIKGLSYVVDGKEVDIESYHEEDMSIYFEVNSVFLVKKDDVASNDFLIIRENEIRIRSDDVSLSDLKSLEQYLKKNLYDEYKNSPYLKHGVYISYFTMLLPGLIRFSQLGHE